MHRLAIIGLAAVVWLVAIPVRADETADLRKQIDDLKAMIQQMQADHQKQIEALNKKIDDLTAKVESAQGQTETQQDVIDAIKQDTAAATQAAATAAGQQTSNPDISAIIDWTGSLVRGSGHRTNDGFSLREVELGFGADVDPYTRADVFLGVGDTAGEGNIDVEEAYLTDAHLRPNLQAKAGKFLAEFGRANTMHLHAFPWVDYPLAMQTYLGDEGMHGVGLSFAYLLPMRHFSEVTVQSFSAEGESFAGQDSNKLTYLAHWNNFFELSAASSLAIGASYATGPNDPNNTRLGTTLWGADLTYKWRPPKEGLYKALWWQSEGYWSNRDLDAGPSVSAWGMYSSLVYQFQRRWSTGVRYDYVQNPTNDALRQTQWAANLTLSPSEFQFWRLEYRHLIPESGESENQFWLQYDAGIGPHRAHKW